ncbi:mediator complex, subunit, putative [Anopheles sinensis]|uniref:Mediator of RNA polymerase II transcription subunit 15 n=1 Tax=Anopheles sinensis TaxID=74873 RepID=A0A084W810_ANOSI|nr:mediator complex, subunit, putative [Anopheles sinensis]
MAEDNSWKTSNFRQSVVNKINEAIQQTGMTSSKNGIEMENHVFHKARNKDEYLGFVARLILHVREMNTKHKNQQNAAAAAQQQAQQEGGGGTSQQGGGMPDPINALQNLASQGTRPQMMDANGWHGGWAGMQGNRVGMGPGPGGQMGGMMGPNQMQGPGPGAGMVGGMPGQMGVNMGPGGMGSAKMGQGGPVQQMAVGPGGPNQMNPMVMGQIQAQLQNQNTMGGQQMGAVVGGGINPGNQMGPMVGANSGMNAQAMGMGGGGGPVGAIGGPIGGPGGPGGVPMQQALQQQAAAMGPNAVGGPNQMNPMGPGGGGGGGGVVGPGQGQMLVGAGQGGGGQQQQGGFVGMAGNPMVRKPPDMMPGGNVYPGGGGAVRSVTPNNFLRQSPSPTVPSPAGPGVHGPPSHPGQQMIPSPALIPSPNPVGGMGSVPQRSIGQSPGASLNTPGQPGGAVQSPLNPQDEQLYREKYRSLTKYIEPLKRMIAKMENDDIDKIAKMKRLLEILSNPSVRIPLETLHKCEAALTSQLGSIRETPTNNPLVEAISSTLQSANGNLTLQRTFRPCLEALYGPDIKNLPPPTKQPRQDDPSSGTAAAPGAGSSAGTGATSAPGGMGGGGNTGAGAGASSSSTQEIPHILQVEIARLDQKFKVSLDQCAISGTKTIKLMIKLDDMNLPCVPPVAVTIPEDYPYTAPTCSLIDQDYNGTPFLILVQKSFMARICKLPGFFTLSHLLDTWEMSVRQACSPNPTIVTPTATSVLLGM